MNAYMSMRGPLVYTHIRVYPLNFIFNGNLGQNQRIITMPPLRRLAHDPGIKKRSMSHQIAKPCMVNKETNQIPIPLPMYR